MVDVLRALFWLWLAVSLSIYTYRLVRRITRGKAPAPPTTTVSLRTSPGEEAPREGALVQKVMDEELAARGEATAGPGGATGDSPLAAPGPGPTAVPAATVEATGAARSGLFASTAPPPPAPTPSPRGATTVAEALEGIAMPAGLVPLVGDPGDLDPYRVAFSTSGVPAGDVGAAVGDELERLGFAVRSVGGAEVEATRGSATVHVVLHPRPDQVVRAAKQAFPLARPGDVVVEFWT